MSYDPERDDFVDPVDTPDDYEGDTPEHVADVNDRAAWDLVYAMDGPSIDLDVERGYVQDGRTFSPEAIEAAVDAFRLWVGTRVMRRWDATNEPPTAVHVTVTVDVH